MSVRVKQGSVLRRRDRAKTDSLLKKRDKSISNKTIKKRNKRTISSLNKNSVKKKKEEYSHDLTQITIKNSLKTKKLYKCTTKKKKTRLPKGSWQKKLEKVNKTIKEFKINKDVQFMLSINDNKTIKPNDINAFQQILTSTSPPINIKIITMDAATKKNRINVKYI